MHCRVVFMRWAQLLIVLRVLSACCHSELCSFCQINYTRSISGDCLRIVTSRRVDHVPLAFTLTDRGINRSLSLPLAPPNSVYCSAQHFGLVPPSVAADTLAASATQTADTTPVIRGNDNSDGNSQQPVDTTTSDSSGGEFTDRAPWAEYIVVFTGYYTEKARRSFIEASLRCFNSSSSSSQWTVLEHNALVRRWPSDFDVVRLNGCATDASCAVREPLADGAPVAEGDSAASSWRRGPLTQADVLSALQRHRYVRIVSPQRRLTRALNAHSYGDNCDSINGTDGVKWSIHMRRWLLASLWGSSAEEAAGAASSSMWTQAAVLADARLLWTRYGERGQAVRVAVFDTGLRRSHGHFGDRVCERTNWTDEPTWDDLVGHGTFVAGVIGSAAAVCPGVAPAVQLHIFRVFSRHQTSFTSWFLDAFNYAIARRVHVLNLSIGGLDYGDEPFTAKVRELAAHNVLLVSAVGNGGPLYGTGNNPADHWEVMGVGATTAAGRLATFSSRGMTGWELPAGYGRVKPDLVAPGVRVRGSGVDAGCRVLSGTSVAAPVVAAAAALLVGAALRLGSSPDGGGDAASRASSVNPALIKQALVTTAHRLPSANMFEQGAGQLQLLAAHAQLLSGQLPAVTAVPAYLDFTECAYMWPYCSQPLYHGARPVIVNVTLTNSLCVSARVRQRPVWQPDTGSGDPLGRRLLVAVSHSDVVWPWSGWLAVHLTVAAKASGWRGVVRGRLAVTVECLQPVASSPPPLSATPATSATVYIPVRARVIATPPRSRRLLWDQFHSLHYPLGYFPRDWISADDQSAAAAAGASRTRAQSSSSSRTGPASASANASPLDWLGDHVHTNFRDMYVALRSAGYYVEVLGEPYTCFDAGQYGTLLVVDTEDEFFERERAKLYADVTRGGLSLLVAADWYNVSVMQRVRFYDDNSGRWRVPLTGGANVPALNRLLAPWRVAFGDRVLSGPMTSLFAADAALNSDVIRFASGVPLLSFPADGLVVRQMLRDQGAEIVDGRGGVYVEAPVLGLLQTGGNASRSAAGTSGRLAVLGDSDCLDSARSGGRDCFSLLTALLQFTTSGLVPSSLLTSAPGPLSADWDSDSDRQTLPQTPAESLLRRVSRVLHPSGDGVTQRPLPACQSVQEPHADGRLQWALVSGEQKSESAVPVMGQPGAAVARSPADTVKLFSDPVLSATVASDSALPSLVTDSAMTYHILPPALLLPLSALLLLSSLILLYLYSKLRNVRRPKQRRSASNMHV